VKLLKSEAMPFATDRLLIRLLRGDDHLALERISSEKKLAGLIPARNRALATATKLARNPKSLAATETAVELAVILKRSGKLIGACDLSATGQTGADVGYMLSSRHWGYGYGSELAVALTDIGFSLLGLRTLTAFVAVDNERSRRALHKAGFLWQALARRHSRIAGRWLDCHYLIARKPHRLRSK
jgi:RimJ/RimL family protein N-acetyltransferase